MREKDIKRLVLKQLKKDFPRWRQLSRKEKKRLAKQVLDDVLKSHASDDLSKVPLNELTNTPAVPEGVIPLGEMGRFVEETTRSFLSFPNRRWRKHFDDPELRSIDALIDDRVLNRLLATESFTASMRDVFPSHYVRAELLKSLRYSEISYRKYCDEVINRLDSKRERAFLHLPLHKPVRIDHSQLSRFRTGISLREMMNLMVYMIHLLSGSGKIPRPFQLCGVDSTDVAVVCRPYPVAKVKVGGKTVRIYSELDADCGKRRKKRDKSDYFVGYRLHTLVAIDPESGHNYPLFSLAAPGNHHDNLFLGQLLAFGKAMGLGTKVITADEGYADTQETEKIQREYGVTVITTVGEKASIPEHVDPETGAVYMNGNCEVAMSYAGRTESGHEFCCNSGECFHAPTCLRCREIALDTGFFGQIPEQVEGVGEIRSVRKNIERVYNLLKHREGLEPLRVRSQHSLMAAATFAQMATLLLEIAGTRRTAEKGSVPKQLRLGP
jgi:hypothetical protein